MPTTDAVEFVRFCYHRRRVGWPELYDEMCAVANRGHYRGWGVDELGAEGIGFTLFEMPALASLVSRVVAEEHERRLTARAIVAEARAAAAAEAAVTVQADHQTDRKPDRQTDRQVEVAAEAGPRLRFARATVGA